MKEKEERRKEEEDVYIKRKLDRQRAQAQLNAFDKIGLFKDKAVSLTLDDVKLMNNNTKIYNESQLTDTIDEVMHENHMKHYNSPEETFSYKPVTFIDKNNPNHQVISHDEYQKLLESKSDTLINFIRKRHDEKVDI